MSGERNKSKKGANGGPSTLRKMLKLQHPSLSIKDASSLILKAREQHGGSLRKKRTMKKMLEMTKQKITSKMMVMRYLKKLVSSVSRCLFTVSRAESIWLKNMDILTVVVQKKFVNRKSREVWYKIVQKISARFVARCTCILLPLTDTCRSMKIQISLSVNSAIKVLAGRISWQDMNKPCTVPIKLTLQQQGKILQNRKHWDARCALWILLTTENFFLHICQPRFVKEKQELNWMKNTVLNATCALKNM